MLATKAARGAGAPPAQAAQFGAAARWHLGMGQRLEALDQALNALPDGPILTLPLALAQMVEQARGGKYHGPLPVPVCALTISYLATLPYAAQMDAQGLVTLDPTTPAPRQPPVRIDLSDTAYQRWSALAARLLVPESEASRLSGAGAGLTDND